MYNLLLKSSVKDDLKRLDKKFVKNILDALESLPTNPYPRNAKKLVGFENLYRLRVGNYRVIYEVNSKEMTIIVYYVRHRKDAYKF